MISKSGIDKSKNKNPNKNSNSIKMINLPNRTKSQRKDIK
jgi:hypothetical protein